MTTTASSRPRSPSGAAARVEEQVVAAIHCDDEGGRIFARAQPFVHLFKHAQAFPEGVVTVDAVDEIDRGIALAQIVFVEGGR